MLTITSTLVGPFMRRLGKRLKWCYAYTGDPYLMDAWMNRTDVGPDFLMNLDHWKVPPVPKMDFQDADQLKQVGLYPNLDKKGPHSPFFYKGRGQSDPGLVRWIWNPKTGQFIFGTGEFTQHAMMIPYDEEKNKAGNFGDWVRGFWEPKFNTILVRPYFNPRHRKDEWNDTHAEVNAKIMEQVERMLRAHLEPVLGSDLRIITNVDNDDVRKLTGRARV